MLKNSTSRISSFRTSYSLGLSFILALLFVSMLFAQQANAKATDAEDAGYDGNKVTITPSDIGFTLGYTIVASAGSGGTISPSGTVSVGSGSSQTFTITPSYGYTIASVLVDGSSVGAVASYTFSNIAANHTISATFAGGASYTITASAGSNGTISPSGAVTVNSGASQTFSFTPATGYQVSSILVDGTAVTTASSYTFSNVTAGHTISVTFAPITCTITPSAGANGTISPSGAVTVNYGTNQSFSFTPATGYQVSSVLVDGSAVTTASSYTFSNVTAGHTISVSFAPITYTITPSAGANGTISPSGVVTINYGTNQSFSFTPATGYQVSSILVDGSAVTTASSYTFSNVTANHTISVSFTPVTYTITASAGSNGTISPSGAVTVNYGTSQSFSFTPATGYQVSSVLVDGTAVTTASSYTFSNVTASHTISLSFAPITYTITPSAGANGTISPSGAVTVNYGTNQSLFIHPGNRLPSFKRPGRRDGSNNRIELQFFQCDRQSHYQRLLYTGYLHPNAIGRVKRHDFAIGRGDGKLRDKPDLFIHPGNRVPGIKHPGRRHGSSNRIQLHFFQRDSQPHYQRLLCTNYLHDNAICGIKRHNFAIGRGDCKLRANQSLFIHPGNRLPGFKRPGRRVGSNNCIELHFFQCDREPHYKRLLCTD